VYLPLIKIIRANQILKNFPDRSEADLYLWIIEHLWYLRQGGVDEVSFEDAAAHFVNNYSKNRIQTFLSRFFKRPAPKTDPRNEPPPPPDFPPPPDSPPKN